MVVVAVAIKQKFQTALDLTLRKRAFSKRRAQAPKRAAQVTAVFHSAKSPQQIHQAVMSGARHW